jgi:hypothetical protein
MKKTILALLLLVTLTGLANAYPYVPSIIKSITTDPDPIIVGQPFDITVTVQNPVVDGNCVTWWVTDANGNYITKTDGLVLPVGNGLGTSKFSNAIVNVAGITSIEVGIGGADYAAIFKSINKNAVYPTSVPEFPTIAAPVAAILGLLVIFGSRKNMF